ncbi:hypothetical protein CKAN_01298500 [Cinnamomum micranthum f. kanehirae]|uniref:Uncharacterized protein n=1 Tax=Cinnamomum micranthum f. kanehirae TaxID=337451 RepID=A0A3S3QGQ6_9MAGN|nr:hypothetical protein CKAN_01298500 [Cinnamomum micranthum f. kanehirae]
MPTTGKSPRLREKYWRSSAGLLNNSMKWTASTNGANRRIVRIVGLPASGEDYTQEAHGHG